MIKAEVNPLGIVIEKEDISKLLKADSFKGSDHILLEKKKWLDRFFGFAANSLNEEILKRYIEATTSELYIGVMPHNYEVFENILVPLKSAKRCYCFGEYLASIELSAHIAEMLAILLKVISPIHIKDGVFSKQMERAVFGSEFEKLGQERRLEVLKAFKIIDNAQYDKFNYIRSTRRKYFHLWGSAKAELLKDALSCFKNVVYLTKRVLEIKVTSEIGRPLKYEISTALKDYLEAHKGDKD